MSLGKLAVRYPMFRDQVEPKGRLLVAKECHACWYYYMLADKCRVNVGDGPASQIIVADTHAGITEIPDWMENRFHQIAKTVAMMYELDSPDDFLPYFPVVQREAERLGFTVHPSLLRPFMVGIESRNLQ